MEDDPLTTEWLDRLVELDEKVRVAPDAEIPLPNNGQEWEAIRRLLTTLQGVHSPTSSAADAERVTLPQTIGRYAVKRQIGSGGFATVYQCRDDRLDRDVALKVPHPPVLLNPESRQRFLREAQSAARLDHPCIVPALEAGEVGAVPYIAYAYCSGESLANLLKREGAMEPGAAALLVELLAEAVQYSHALGVLHRDIKPANVLLFPAQGFAPGELPFIPRLTDFGLAKLIEADLEQTASNLMLGTPRYMAPEQISQGRRTAGAAVDVYGLGAVLYEVLTGKPPFTAETAWDVLTQICEYPPAAPRLLKPSIPRALETICLTCLAKDPAERYPSAGKLAEDLHRYRSGRPIQARRTPFLRRAGLWIQRHRIVAPLVGVLGITLLAFVVTLLAYSVSVRQLGRQLADKTVRLSETITQLHATVAESQRHEQAAQTQATALAQTVYSMEIGRAAAAWRKGDATTMSAALVPYQNAHNLREFAWHYLWHQQALPKVFAQELPAPQHAIRFSADGRWLAAAGADSTIRIHSVPGYKLQGEIFTDQQEINGLAIDPHGRWIASTGDDGSLALWDRGSRQALHRWPVFSGAPAYQVAYSEVLDLFAVCGNQPEIHLLQSTAGEHVGTLAGVHRRGVESISLSPDGKKLISCGADDHAVIWDLVTRKPIHDLAGEAGFAMAAAWSNGGQETAVAFKSPPVTLFWRADTAEKIGRLVTTDAIHSLTVSRFGDLVAGDTLGCLIGMSRRMNDNIDHARRARPESRWSIHNDRIYAVVFSPDGEQVATASRDRTIGVFNFRLPEPVAIYEAATGDMHCIETEADADGTSFYLAGRTLYVRLSRESKPTAIQPDIQFRSMARSADTLWAGDFEGRIHRWSLPWDVDSHRVQSARPGMPIDKILCLGGDAAVLAFGWSPLVHWHSSSGSLDSVLTGYRQASLAPDGRRLAVVDSTRRRLTLVDTDSLMAIRSATLERTETVHTIEYSPRGRYLVTGSGDRNVRVYDAETLEEIWLLRGHEAAPIAASVSHDERTLATADELNTVFLWDLRAGRPLLQLYQHTEPILHLRFTPDDKSLLATENRERELRWSVDETVD